MRARNVAHPGGRGEDIPGPAGHKLCPSSLQAELSEVRPEADDEALAKAFGTSFAAGPHGLLSRFVGGSYGKILY